MEPAVNLYHTSAEALFPQVLVTPEVAVELESVPDVFEHEEPGVNVVAPEQLSFDGGFCTQIVNPQVPELTFGLVVTYTRA